MGILFKNKVAIITGGHSGIGKATAIAFAKEGAKVVIADITDHSETLSLIRNAGFEASFVKCDVSQEKEVKNLVDKTVALYGQLDFAFNNAGIEGVSSPIEECTEENWDQTLGTNLKGIWLCMKHELLQMHKQGNGVIVNCSSVAGLVGFMNSPAYVASKHGVVGLTKAGALENAKRGIRINAVCPGVIKTPMIDRFTGKKKEVEQLFADQEPVGRLGQPEEIANAVIWLCSEAASFVTGQALAVDGGWVAQ